MICGCPDRCPCGDSSAAKLLTREAQGYRQSFLLPAGSFPSLIIQAITGQSRSASHLLSGCQFEDMHRHLRIARSTGLIYP